MALDTSSAAAGTTPVVEAAAAAATSSSAERMPAKSSAAACTSPGAAVTNDMFLTPQAPHEELRLLLRAVILLCPRVIGRELDCPRAGLLKPELKKFFNTRRTRPAALARSATNAPLAEDTIRNEPLCPSGRSRWS